MRSSPRIHFCAGICLVNLVQVSVFIRSNPLLISRTVNINLPSSSCRQHRGNSDDRSASWFAVIEGLLWLLCGLCGLILPGMTAVLMLYIIAAWAVLTGYNEVVIGFLSGMDIHWINFFNGCGLIILGSYLYAESPTEGILTLLWAVGVQGTIGGTFLLVTSFRLRREQLTRNTQQEEEHPST